MPTSSTAGASSSIRGSSNSIPRIRCSRPSASASRRASSNSRPTSTGGSRTIRPSPSPSWRRSRPSSTTSGSSSTASGAIAGYTTPGPDKGQAALVIGNEERTAFRGFLDAQNSADLDGDGVPDGVELWENLAFGIGQGFFTDVTWLSEDPTTGAIGVGASDEVTLTIGDPNLAPGEYRASVVFQ